MIILDNPNICAGLALLSLGIAIVATVGVIIITFRINDMRRKGVTR